MTANNLPISISIRQIIRIAELSLDLPVFHEEHLALVSAHLAHSHRLLTSSYLLRIRVLFVDMRNGGREVHLERELAWPW